jgi:MYXO-CTERM domain-containing protein
VQKAKLTASDGKASDEFGYSVAVSGDKVVVGAPLADISDQTEQGAAYVFQLVQLIPAMTHWGTMLFALLLTLGAIFGIRRRRET